MIEKEVMPGNIIRLRDTPMIVQLVGGYREVWAQDLWQEDSQQRERTLASVAVAQMNFDHYKDSTGRRLPPGTSFVDTCQYHADDTIGSGDITVIDAEFAGLLSSTVFVKNRILGGLMRRPFLERTVARRVEAARQIALIGVKQELGLFGSFVASDSDGNVVELPGSTEA
jgi:hypothetical protein